MLLDGCGELLQRLLVPGHTRLRRVRDDLLERQFAHRGRRAGRKKADDAGLRVGFLLEDPTAGIAERFLAVRSGTTCEHRSPPSRGRRNSSPRRTWVRTPRSARPRWAPRRSSLTD